MHPEVQAAIRGLSNRTKILCGTGVRADGSDIMTSVPAALQAVLERAKDPEQARKNELAAAELIKQSWTNDEKKQLLCGLRMESTQNYVYASVKIIGMFFDIVELKNDERPVFQNNTMQEVQLYYMGQDGKPRQSEVIPSQEETLVPLKLETTGEVGYRINDIYNGDVRQAALSTLNLAFDKRAHMDSRAFDLMAKMHGNFVLSGKKAVRTYVPHSRIHADVLPTTNNITVTGATTATNFTTKVMDAAMRYCDRWVDAFPDGNLRPTGRILVSALDTQGLLEQVIYTGGNNNRLETPQDNFTTIDHGIRWTLVPDNTIAPGDCYVELNKKPGRIYLKPGMDQEYVTVTPQKNWESRYQSYVFGAYFTNQERVRALKIRYRLPA